MACIICQVNVNDSFGSITLYCAAMHLLFTTNKQTKKKENTHTQKANKQTNKNHPL